MVNISNNVPSLNDIMVKEIDENWFFYLLSKILISNSLNIPKSFTFYLGFWFEFSFDMYSTLKTKFRQNKELTVTSITWLWDNSK